MPVKLLTILCLLVSVHRVCAEVGDVTLQTDHEQYPGEGVFQSPAQCVNWATRDPTTDHEKSLAIFQWLLTHQWHLMSPQEWCIPGRVPGANPNDYEMVVYDANKGRFSYGYGLCGTVHAWNEVYWQAAGFPARRRAFPGHTNSEIFYDGKWRMYDTDMAGIVFNHDGSVAGYDEISSDLSLLERPARFLAPLSVRVALRFRDDETRLGANRAGGQLVQTLSRRLRGTAGDCASVIWRNLHALPPPRRIRRPRQTPLLASAQRRTEPGLDVRQWGSPVSPGA